MNEYKIIYECNNGYVGEEIITAVNRMMAFEAFKELGIADVVNVDCFRVLDLDMERYVIGKDFNTKDWFIYDNVTNWYICWCDTEEEAVKFVKEVLL